MRRQATTNHRLRRPFVQLVLQFAEWAPNAPRITCSLKTVEVNMKVLPAFNQNLAVRARILELPVNIQ